MYFMDDSFRAFGIDPGTNADQLRQIVIEKIELKEDSCFALFEKKGEWGMYSSIVAMVILLPLKDNSRNFDFHRALHRGQ